MAASPSASLSGLDTAFLSLETASTPMHMVGVFIVDPAPTGSAFSFERICELMDRRAPDLMPLRRRLASIPFGLDYPVWVDDVDFQVRRHIYRSALPAPGSEPILANLVAQVASQRLDRTRPLWELWVVEGLADARVALVFKIHHAVADGLSAIQLLMRLLDPSPGEAIPSVPPERRSAVPAPTSRSLVAHALSRLPRRSVRLARLLVDSTRAAGGAAHLAALGAKDGARSPLPFDGPRTPWAGSTSPQRTVAFGRARLADVRYINSVFGTTVNHVVLAACTQTLRSYLEARGVLPSVPLLAAIPISVRSPSDPDTSGNRVSVRFVGLPVHLSDPIEQLLAVRHAARRSNGSHAQPLIGILARWAEFLPSVPLGWAARFYSERKLAARHHPVLNLVVSNLRGPAERLHAAGAPVVATYPLGPVMGGGGLNITVASYVDSLSLGVIACERSLPQASELADGFASAVEVLVSRALGEDSIRHPAGSVEQAAGLPRALLASDGAAIPQLSAGGVM